MIPSLTRSTKRIKNTKNTKSTRRRRGKGKEERMVLKVKESQLLKNRNQRSKRRRMKEKTTMNNL